MSALYATENDFHTYRKRGYIPLSGEWKPARTPLVSQTHELPLEGRKTGGENLVPVFLRIWEISNEADHQ